MARETIPVVSPLLFIGLCFAAALLVAQIKVQAAQPASGASERLIVANAVVTLDIDVARLNGNAGRDQSKLETLRFTAGPDSFFTVVASGKLFRGPEQGTIALVAQGVSKFPEALKASANQLLIEKSSSDDASDLVIRDGRTGLILFIIEGHQYDYDATKHLLNISGGRVLLSQDFAKQLGDIKAAGGVIGQISIVATLYPIQIGSVMNGSAKSGRRPASGTTPGPDVIVGEITAMVQAGTPNGGVNGNYVGLGIGTTACNAGTENVDWFPLPNNDHPFIAQNLYRLSGGPDNADRIEQIGQSWVKHTYTASTGNVCGYGCNGVGDSYLGSGCSDPYTASLNNNQNILGSRAWTNPFTGYFPGSNPDPNNHLNHKHTGTSHRVTVSINDLDPALNAGATYFAEGHYVTPHEYAWCQSHPGQCNMYNNVSYRQFNINSSGNPFTFAAAAPTQRTKRAIEAWTGATINQFEPDPGSDGIGVIGYKITNPSAGVWHYEYAVYNQNLDRAIQSFSVPLGCGLTISNLSFHSPPQEPAWPNDATQNNAGYSAVPWAPNQTVGAITWSCETFAQNQNANAIRWGTLYNFGFDSNRPPHTAQGMLGFFKTGSPIQVAIQAPAPDPCNPLRVSSVVSRKMHGGTGFFDISLPLSGATGVECRSTNGNHAFVFTFSNDVVSGNASVTSGVGHVTDAFFDANTMTVELADVADQQQIVVTVSGITDAFGQILPDTAVTAAFLMGDSTGNRSVNSSDVIQTKMQVGVDVDATNYRSDVNANGAITASDVTLVKSQVGKSLP